MRHVRKLCFCVETVCNLSLLILWTCISHNFGLFQKANSVLEDEDLTLKSSKIICQEKESQEHFDQCQHCSTPFQTDSLKH